MINNISELLAMYSLVKELLDKKIKKKDDKFEEYVEKIFQHTEVIVKNYMDMFSEIRINTISGKFKLNDIINYLLEREYELKDIRVFIRSFLNDKYYESDEVLVKFVAAIYGIMECYPVENRIIIDKSRHTLNSYICYCNSLLMEDEEIQKKKILLMTNGILKDITTSWETVCKCYKKLKLEKM